MRAGPALMVRTGYEFVSKRFLMEPGEKAEVIIPLSKSKVALLLLGSVAFVGTGIWIWSIAETQSRFDPLLMKGVALACVSFFGLCGIYGCIKFFDRRPGLIIDTEGIVDNSSAVSVGRILWGDVVGLKVSSISGQRFLTIEVVDPQKYVDRGSALTRMLNAASVKMTGSPINISSNSLGLKLDELVHLVTEAFETNKRADQT
jgi:hypothetical protein